ncbi:MAG: pyridoxamine 5'-phosphate oxidase family protein [Candidatus Levybacteria bacterium]|nr:pyridoxamine 5'-phosphate oxidase family protein [Candidatus Levybacteria bacterium]
MVVGANGDFPWIATVYYTFDQDLNLYFLSSPDTLHVKQILQNPKVAIVIADSNQDINKSKSGLQLSGIAQQISGLSKIKYALKLWKTNLGVVNPKLTDQAVKGSMFKITPKRIKLFDQKIFPVADGKEPVLEF